MLLLGYLAGVLLHVLIVPHPERGKDDSLHLLSVSGPQHITHHRGNRIPEKEGLSCLFVCLLVCDKGN